MSTMSGTFSPIEIIYLLHCFCVREPYHNRSSAIIEAEKRFFCADLIEHSSHDDVTICVTTPRGDALAEMFMGTPLPKRVWIDPRNQEVVG